MHYLKKVKRLESNIYKDLQQDKKVSHKEEMRLYRNGVKKSNAKAEANREMRNFDTKLNMYLRNRFKLVNQAVSMYIHSSYRCYSIGQEKYYVLEQDRDILSQIDYTAEYTEGPFNDLLKTTSFGKNLSIIDSKTYSELNIVSKSFNNINNGVKCNKISVPNSEESLINKYIEQKLVNNITNSDKLSMLLSAHRQHLDNGRTVQFNTMTGAYDDLLGLSIGPIENKDKNDSSLIESTETLNIVFKPDNNKEIMDDNYITMNNNFRKSDKHKSMENLTKYVIIPKNQ